MAALQMEMARVGKAARPAAAGSILRAGLNYLVAIS
jgi:hypothetical protein